jgi:hypothetical protein
LSMPIFRVQIGKDFSVQANSIYVNYFSKNGIGIMNSDAPVL